jgi:hypothetical protein
MTIGPVGSNGGHFDAWSSEEASFSPTSVSGELAVLMLETNENQKEIDRDQLTLARADYADALADEVQSLRDAADAKFRGACVEAGLAGVSAGLGLWSVKTGEKSWQAHGSTGLEHVAKPVGEMLSKTYGDAGAAAARGEEKAAEWRIDDTRTNLKDEDGVQNKALDWLSSMLDQDAATMNAILSNKV